MLLFLTCLMFFSAHSPTLPSPIPLLKAYTQQHYPNKTFGNWVYISVAEQQLYYIENWEVTASYRISTGAKGTGNLDGSGQTPLGLHEISDKIGDGVPIGGVLRSRKYTQQVTPIFTDRSRADGDYVTTRILWLNGLENGINRGKNAAGKSVDTHSRYIYMHGTPEEGLLGTPVSHGCIRLANADIVQLFNTLPLGTMVLILE